MAKLLIPALILVIVLTITACQPGLATSNATPSAQASHDHTLPANMSYFPVALNEFAGTPYPAALVTGHLTDPEPLPKGDPLWKFPNVVITPHTSGGSDNLEARLNNLVKENIRRFGKGLPLLNVVNKKEGF